MSDIWSSSQTIFCTNKYLSETSEALLAITAIKHRESEKIRDFHELTAPLERCKAFLKELLEVVKSIRDKREVLLLEKNDSLLSIARSLLEDYVSPGLLEDAVRKSIDELGEIQDDPKAVVTDLVSLLTKIKGISKSIVALEEDRLKVYA
jgi:uncharacterized coiled-coil DUF342 family protein